MVLSDAVVNAANLCQLAVPFIGFFAYLPQWTKLVRTKSSRDLSLRSWCLWIVSSVAALFYAIVQLLLNGRGWPLVVACVITLVSVLFTVSLIVRYRRGREEAGT